MFYYKFSRNRIDNTVGVVLSKHFDSPSPYLSRAQPVTVKEFETLFTTDPVFRTRVQGFMETLEFSSCYFNGLESATDNDKVAFEIISVRPQFDSVAPKHWFYYNPCSNGRVAKRIADILPHNRPRNAYRTSEILD